MEHTTQTQTKKPKWFFALSFGLFIFLFSVMTGCDNVKQPDVAQYQETDFKFKKNLTILGKEQGAITLELSSNNADLLTNITDKNFSVAFFDQYPSSTQQIKEDNTSNSSSNSSQLEFDSADIKLKILNAQLPNGTVGYQIIPILNPNSTLNKSTLISAPCKDDAPSCFNHSITISYYAKKPQNLIKVTNNTYRYAYTDYYSKDYYYWFWSWQGSRILGAGQYWKFSRNTEWLRADCRYDLTAGYCSAEIY